MNGQQNADAPRRREHREPFERENPVPWLLGLVSAGLLVWGVSYFLLNPALTPPGSVQSRTSDATPTANITAAAPDGAQIFASRCAACHQATGAGVPGVFPPLAGSEWVNGDPGQVVRILLLGITGSISVKGNTFSGSMPAWGSSLSDPEIAAVVSHIRSNFGNTSSRVTVKVVTAERAALGGRTTPLAGESELKAHR